MTKTLQRLLTRLEKEKGFTSVTIDNYSIYNDQDGSSKFLTIENLKTKKHYFSDINRNNYFDRESTIELMYKAINIIKKYLSNN